MFIAFEGPDETGKSTSARELDFLSEPTYNATKEIHEGWQNQDLDGEHLVHTYDRIDWFSHMVYRLALPDREWNDARPRTVFTMPDTHLVVKLHRPDMANFKAPNEVVDTPLATVNEMYFYQTDFLLNLNRAREYALFKSVTIVEVVNDGHGRFDQRIADHDSPAYPDGSAAQHMRYSDETLLEFLRDVDHQIG